MATYTVHSREAGDPDDIRFIREGFSRPALLFGPFWLAATGLWIVLAVVLALELLLMAVGQGASLSGLALLPAFFGIHLLLGLEGANLRRWTLGLRGYREVAVEAAGSLEEAEARYFASLPPAAPPGPWPAGEALPPHERDALGLFAPPGNV